MNHIDTMKLALEALEDFEHAIRYDNEQDEIGERVCCGVLSYNPHTNNCKTVQAITALQAALAEQPAPATWTPEDELRPQDIRVEMYPPQPTSGMVVGMSKGVRLIHTPTGTIVECDTERSQHRNREVALKKLKAALAEQPAQGETK